MLSQISATTLQNISDRSVVTVCFLWFYQYSECASLFFCCWGFFFHVVASFTFLLHVFSFCHTSMPTYTDQTMLKVTKHLFYLCPPFYTLSLPHPPIPPIAPVPAVHPCVIDRGVHISLLPPFSTPVSPEPPHPSLLPAITRWLTTCLQQSTKAAITLHVQQRETHTHKYPLHTHPHTNVQR